MTDSEQSEQPTGPVIEPEEGETYMAAYQRHLQGEDTEVLGVLTGQVPVKSAPIAMAHPESEDEGSE